MNTRRRIIILWEAWTYLKIPTSLCFPQLPLSWTPPYKFIVINTDSWHAWRVSHEVDGISSIDEAQEPERREISGSDVDQIPLTLTRKGWALTARPRHGSDMSGKSESDLSGVNIGHFGSCFHETTDPIYSSHNLQSPTPRMTASSSYCEINEASKRCRECSRVEACVTTRTLRISLALMRVAGTVPPLGHHPKFDRCRRVNQEMVEWLWARGQFLHKELEWLEWCGEQVYRTLAHNTVASWAIVDQLTPLLPKDDEQVVGKVKQLLHCSI
jgi:hypothetical protein